MSSSQGQMATRTAEIDSHRNPQDKRVRNEDGNDCDVETTVTRPAKVSKVSDASSPRQITRTPTRKFVTPRQLHTPQSALPAVARAKAPTTQAPTTPTPAPVADKASTPTDTVPATPRRTPASTRPLHSIPEVASRYIPQTDTAAGVDTRDPHRFTLKPGFWRRWSPALYSAFAAELRRQFDPVPFARRSGLPLDEVRHMFGALVADPLYDAAIAAARGEEGMTRLLDCFAHAGTQKRWWGKVLMHRLEAELDRVVDKGVVLLIGADGSKITMRAEEFGAKDVEYLDVTLSPEDKAVLYG